MAEQTGTALEQQAHRIFELVDAMDTDAMTAMFTDDAQGVDEISRGWMRGRDALEQYFAQLKQMVDGVSSKLSNVHASDWGDAGVVTCVVQQTYNMGGQEQEITAPTSIIFRRAGDGADWKIAVLHSVPLEEPPDE